jgi:ribonuclease HII
MASPKRRKHQLVLNQEQIAALERISSHDADYIIGIDEVGVGCWAGPVVVAGVAVPKGWSDPMVDDSKELSPARREKALDEVILPAIAGCCLLSNTAEVIDEIGIELAKTQLTEGVALYLRQRFPGCLIVQDGNRPVAVNGTKKNVVCVVKGDSLVPAVSAASIVAKVTRDRYMREQHELYPDFGFNTNVGYHSLKHKHALMAQGPTPLHRRSFRPVKEAISVRKALGETDSEPLTATLKELVNC